MGRARKKRTLVIDLLAGPPAEAMQHGDIVVEKIHGGRRHRRKAVIESMRDRGDLTPEEYAAAVRFGGDWAVVQGASSPPTSGANDNEGGGEEHRMHRILRYREACRALAERWAATRAVAAALKDRDVPAGVSADVRHLAGLREPGGVVRRPSYREVAEAIICNDRPPVEVSGPNDGSMILRRFRESITALVSYYRRSKAGSGR